MAGLQNLKIAGVIAVASLVASGQLSGQGRAGQPAAAPTPRAAAPVDLTGYWVAVVTEDWRWRMVTPPKGDYASIPLTAEAKRIADAWDPAKDEAAGEQCRSYGAAAIMRVPARVHITWQDESTLKVEVDAGTQTRLLHFGSWKPAPGARPSWQGDSVAVWETPVVAGGAGGSAGAAPLPGAATEAKFGNLKVVTTRMRPGYLRKNGVPYSGDAVLTEYWDVHRERNGDQWLVVTTLVDDPKYLQLQWVTSPNFKKEPDGSKWDPTPCSARW